MGIVLTIAEGPYANKRYECQPYEAFILGRDMDPKSGPGFPNDPYMSRRHVFFEISGDQARVEDLDSRNGVFVNDVRVRHQDLRDGDKIQAGRTVMLVTIEQTSPVPPRPVPQQKTAPPRKFATPPPGGHLPPQRPAAPKKPAPPTRVMRREPPIAPPEPPSVAAGPSPEPVDPAPAKPRTRSDFDILDEIARGGLGVVYRAKERASGRIVALKVMRNTMEMDELARAHFVREMRIISDLQHPNLVETYAVGSGAGEAWIAMEYVPGPDLEQYVRGRGPLDPFDAITVGIQLLRGLGYAHGQGLVHRDVKPANALLSGKRGRIRAKLTDFGLAKSLQSTGASGLTVTGTAKGSPWFVAPEQLADAKSVGVPADLYGFGATLYYALSGKWHLREDGRHHDFLAGILKNKYVSITKRVTVPVGLAHVVDSALRARPKERPPNAQAMEAVLVKTLRNLPRK